MLDRDSFPRSASYSEDRDEEVLRRIEVLQSLRDGDRAVGAVIACGQTAVVPLAKVLLEGKPDSIYEPRRRVVECLAALEAKEVLIDYLLGEKDIADPIVRFGEDAVLNAAARALADRRTPEALQAILEVSRRRLLPGVVDALAEFASQEAIPYFDRALEDDLCREAAEEGFRRIGGQARGALILSAVTPLPDRDGERPSSVLRRRSALNLLVELSPSVDDWNSLRGLLEDPDPQITLRSVDLALKLGTDDDPVQLARRLLSALPALPWDLLEDAKRCLLEIPEAGRLVQEEIIRREARCAAVHGPDSVSRILRHIAQELSQKAHHHVDP